MEFSVFKQAVAKQFNLMRMYDLFRTQVDKDQLWETYLNSFPPGTNPTFRERTEHDCSCCKHFIRAIGNVVAIINGKLVSIWDCQVSDPNYQIVANAMAALVKSQAIENIFLTTERIAGTDKNFEEISGNVTTWEHFFVNIPDGRTRGEKNLVVRGTEIGPRLSEARALHDVLLRSLTELTDDSVETVLDLIAQNSLYRGEEHKFAVDAFMQLKRQFNVLAPEDRDNFVWSKAITVPGSVAKIRNTSIGTLLIDLSEDMELEKAVKKFEKDIMAPDNYKRPVALGVSKAQAEKAKQEVEDMGLTSALERRYANHGDVSVNDVLFVDRQAKKSSGDDVFAGIIDQATSKKPKSMDRVDEIGIEKVITDILPSATSVELMVENSHIPNFVSLIAPVDPTSGLMFKWNNRLSWSYNGDVADSIKERVKKAGGNVSGELCCRLAWWNFDDLDFHMKEPGGYEIYYPNRTKISPCGGTLDVDMNAGGGQTREPVENIFYQNLRQMKEGIYKLQVNQFSKRENSNVGFEVEVDILGQVQQFVYDRAVRQGETITIMEFSYRKAEGIKIISSLPSTVASKSVWGLQTNNFVKVSMITLSPNYWGDNRVGNKHYFFMLDGCINGGIARGFYNEFLKEELNAHRKVLEIVGSKIKIQDAKDQLSGLGFSSTQRNSILCRVTGSFTRVIKILF